jgi:CubicO group peptidase (beta-lactamase class C family)
MIRKFLKSSLSLVLAFALALTPYSVAFSNSLTTDVIEPAAITGLQSDTPSDAAVAFAGTKALAEKKASLLTSIYGLTSIQYALIDQDGIIVSGQSGVYSKEVKRTPSETNLYGIGSVSKMFATVAVMQLLEQGKIHLDAPIVKYIPEFTMDDPRYKDITVRMLLNHSSGLMGSSLSNAMLFEVDNTSYKDILKTLKTSRLKADPGAFSVYCNDGFTLAELLVEKVSGISFTEYIKKNISQPLGLKNTQTPMEEFERYRLVKTYLPTVKNELPTDVINMIGAGGIYSTAQDLCHFAEIFMHDSDTAVLSNISAVTMEQPEYMTKLWPKEEDNVLSYGLGWDSVNTYPFTEYGIRALVKGGDTTLFHGSLIVLPEENMAMAVLSSGGSSSINQILAQEILLSALQEKGSIDIIKANKTFTRPVAAKMPDSIKKYEGIYAYFGGASKVTISDEGTLTLSNAFDENEAKQYFTYTDGLKFYYADGSTYLSFDEAINGNTYLYVSGYSMLPSIGQIASSGYQGQRLKDNPISEEVKAVWEKRENKEYFLISEKYSSQMYLISSLSSKVNLLKGVEGYFMNAAILDENNAQTLIQIPGMYGRDLTDFHFYTSHNTEYVKANESLYISADAINTLPTKETFTNIITVDGYANWFKIGSKSAGRKIKVTVPEHASFTVYDDENQCINASFVTNQTTVTLPEGGSIVFAGDPNALFKITYLD